MRPFLAATTLLMLAGCVRTPTPFALALLQTPERWTAAVALPTAAPDIADAWWTAWNDDALARVVGAAGDTADVRIAAARIAEADAFLRTARAALLPDMAIGASGRMQKVGDGPARQDSVAVRLDAGWEVDLAGVNRARAASALSERDAATLRLAAVRIAARSQAARLYFTRQEAARQRANTEATIASLHDSRALARSRAAAGLASELDVTQAEAALAAAEATAPRFAAAATAAARGLDSLLGHLPGTFDTLVLDPVQAPRPAQARTLFPADVLARRPDVAAAEKMLSASGFDVAAARGAFYPNLRIDTAVGVQRLSDPSPFQDSGLIVAALGGLTAPLLQRERLYAALEAASARQRIAAETHRQIVVAALNEVETVAAAVRYATASADRAMAAVAATELQLQLARTRYKAGASSFLEVIVAEQAVFAARQEMIGTEAEAARSLAALFGAMGLGGEA